LGLAIDARTAVPSWGGERMDYTWTLSMLEQHGQRGRESRSAGEGGAA
jgi:hypothetical protein